MKRRHLRDEVIRLAHELRRLRPDLVFGADLIAGFPTEDEAMFQATLDLVDEAGLTFLHVFPYSPRPGTPATGCRNCRWRFAGSGRPGYGTMVWSCSTGFLRAQIGSRRPALMERGGGGHTDQFAPFRIAEGAPVPPAGRMIALAVDGVADGTLLGHAA